jgi:hypothetical protein
MAEAAIRLRNGKPHPRYSMSWCWSCIHAYGDDCFSVPAEERDWVTEVQVHQRIKSGFGAPDEIMYVREVRECERYEMGRR